MISLLIALGGSGLAQREGAGVAPQVRADLEKLGDILKSVTHLEDVARRQKDVIKLNCVDDKLLQLRQLRHIADDANGELQEALTRGDDQARDREADRVAIVREQAEVLETEAESCIGEELTFIGPTTVKMVEPAVPDDPTVPPGPDYPVVEPLPVASPQE